MSTVSDYSKNCLCKLQASRLTFVCENQIFENGGSLWALIRLQ
jgi:hypothetical protein